MFERLTSLAAGDLSLGQFLALGAQLGLLLVVVQVFQVEQSTGFLLLMPLVVVGFLLHAWLPLRFRLPFFLLLSLAAIVTVLDYKNGAILVGMALGLIGIVHLPIVFWARITLLLAAVAGLVALRAEWITTRLSYLPSIILPILGSMFMFRLVIYLYDLKHENKPVSIWERLSYFFLLPNVCFLLFPVVDFQTFRRTYYDRPAADIYQKGVLWMTRGVIHLLLYRLIYHHMMPTPAEVQGLGSVVQYMLATYLLYLRVSGQFHLIIGILCLFGFNLPETHHLYYLASSFTDYWRRINIYWKDFMMKLFYYPSFMKLRRWGMTTGMVLATCVVFVATWLLHSYQWFWLRGTFLLTGPDTLFWAILGALVVINSLREVKQGRKRSLRQPEWSVAASARHAAKVVGMFVFICLLWSLWSSATVAEWLALMATAGRSGPVAFGVLFLALAALVGVGVAVQYVTHRGWKLTLDAHASFARSALTTGATVLLLVVLGMPQVHASMSGPASELIASVQGERLNQRDELLQERGYYEGLLEGKNFSAALKRINMPKGWGDFRNSELVVKTNDALEYELRPNYRGTFQNAPFEVNRWGMRDRPYEQLPPASTYRMALLGSSYAMASGIRADSVFEARVEERLNEDDAGDRFDRYEILNFGVAGYGPLQYLLTAERKVFAFEPDILVLTIHSTETSRMLTSLALVVQQQGRVEHPYLQELLARSGVRPDMHASVIRSRLEPLMAELMSWSFREMVAVARAHGVPAVAVLLPRTQEAGSLEGSDAEQVLQKARAAGFVTFSIEDAYGDRDEASLWLAAWDKHPNADGHRLLADSFYRLLREHGQAFNLDLADPIALRDE